MSDVYPLIEAEKAEGRSVNRACAVLEVSRVADHEWHQQPPRLAQEGRELAERARAIVERWRQTYGAPRVHRELRRQDVRCSRKRVARIMREQVWPAGTRSGGRRPPSPIPTQTRRLRT